MAARNTITSADAEFFLTVEDLFPSPQRIQGFMADRMFQSSGVDTGEFIMGADGHLSAGYVFNTRSLTVSIMPDSPSNTLFEQIDATQRSGKRLLLLQGVIILKGVKRKYTLSNGYLQNYVPVIGAAKVLEGRPFGLLWESIEVAPN